MSDTTMLLTVPEAASRLRCGIRTLYELVRTGALPSCRVGHAVRIDAAVLQEWIKSGGTRKAHQVGV